MSPEVFEQVVLGFGFDAAVLLDSRGRVLRTWPTSPDLIGDQLADQHAHLAMALDGRTGVSGVAASAATSEPVIAVAVPFDTSSGRRVFSGAFALDSSSLGASFNTIIPLAGRAYLIDDKGDVITSGESITASASPHSLTRAELLGLDQPVGSFARGGQWLTYVREPVAGTPWHIVLVTPSATLYQAVEGSSQVSWVLFTAFAGSGLVGLLLLSRLARARSLAAATARLDALTQLPNRRAAEEHVHNTASTAARRSRPYGVLMIDIDRFKKINDTYGHQTGDDVLAQVARTLRRVARAEDRVSRWGGEEFLVVVAAASENSIAVLAERFRAAVADMNIHVSATKSVTVTISVGGALSTDRAPTQALHAADSALYDAKLGGRNRVVMYRAGLAPRNARVERRLHRPRPSRALTADNLGCDAAPGSAPATGTQPAYSWSSMPTRSAIAIVSSRSGWRTATMPSEITVVCQSRRGAPIGRRSMCTMCSPISASSRDRPSMCWMRPWPWARLKIIAVLYLRSIVLAEAAVDDGLRPAAVDVDVARPVHRVGEAGTADAGSDLAEHDLAVGLEVPLHVGEAIAEAHRREHVVTHGDAGRQRPGAGLAQGDGLRADPLELLHHERSRPVPAHVVVGDAPAGGDRVERELLTVDELLDAHLGHGTEGGQHRPESGGLVDAVGVHRSGAGDRLDDQRVADLLGAGVHVGDRRRSHRARHPDPRRPQDLLHRLLVAERDRAGDVEAGCADALPESGGEVHRRLPHRLDAVDVHAAQRVEHLVDGPLLVGERRDLHVAAQGVARWRRAATTPAGHRRRSRWPPRRPAPR